MRTRVYLLSALALVFQSGTAAVSATGTEGEAAAAARLSLAGIEPTVAGVSAYLAAQIPSEEAQREAEKWIADLRSADFLTRERAERSLLTTGNPPLEALEKAAAEKADLELSLRAGRIFQTVKTRPRTTLHMVLRWAESSPDHAFVPHLLELSAHTKTSVERSLINRVLAVSSAADDLPQILISAADGSPVVRGAAVAALSNIPTNSAADALAGLADDPDETVVLAAAIALAERSDRRCLAPLGKLLLSDSTAQRMRAYHLLTKITGKKWDYSAYSSEEARAGAAAVIAQWISKEGTAADLISGEKGDRPEIYVGRTVVGSWPATFKHYDSDGNVLFAAEGYQYVWGCHGTADGQFAVVDARRNTARIYDAAGKVIWSKEDLPGDPSDIRLLENGNRLITLSTPSRVIELDPSDKLVWDVAFPGRTRSTTAHRLPNGNTLVNLQFGKKVVEVNPDGETIWELTGLKNCLTAQPLPDGNVLVCEMGDATAVEYNREGEIVWSKGGFRNACQAQRLPNGNTLVSDAKGIHEIRPDGEEVSHLEVPRGRFWRY